MGSYTPNQHLYKPAVGEVGWGTLVDANWDILDNCVINNTNDITVQDSNGNGMLVTTVSDITQITGNGEVLINGAGASIDMHGVGQISMTATGGLDLTAAGPVTAPTPSPGDNSTKVATTAYVQTALGSATTKWSSLQNATADLTLANAGFNTTFNQTSAVTWKIANTTAATNTVSQSSPFLKIAGRYWNGSADTEDSWTIQDVIANGTNGTSQLTFTHSGSTGIAAVTMLRLYLTGASTGMYMYNAGSVNGVIFADSGGPNDIVLFKTSNTYQMIGRSTFVYGWANATTLNAGGLAPDTGISRTGAAAIAIGNGTQGDTTGNLQLNQITKYNAETTAGVGVPYERGATSGKVETGADAAVLTVTPTTLNGLYRITIAMSVSAASAATLGWTVTYTDINGIAQAPTNVALFKVGTAAPALTFAAAANDDYYAELIVNVNNAGTNIVVKTTFSGTSISYRVSATVERLI